jgi:hypothetical protein
MHRIAAILAFAAALAGCYSIPDAGERLEALRQQSFGPETRVAVLGIMRVPPYAEFEKQFTPALLDKATRVVADAASAELPAAAEHWDPVAHLGGRSPLVYLGDEIAAGGVRTRLIRDAIAKAGAQGYRAIVSYTVQPELSVYQTRMPPGTMFETYTLIAARGAPYEVRWHKPDGTTARVNRKFKVNAVKASIFVRTLPGDTLIVFDQDTGQGCSQRDDPPVPVDRVAADIEQCIDATAQTIARALRNELAQRNRPR